MDKKSDKTEQRKLANKRNARNYRIRAKIKEAELLEAVNITLPAEIEDLEINIKEVKIEAENNNIMLNEYIKTKKHELDDILTRVKEIKKKYANYDPNLD
ncbi:hypothetical protein MHBO_005177 [Bonamia ostreae]|uniref:BZIP domain-containing protein n=1 Tax=Bonamia ostreae TaxID=126728 RepID=A0ABV2AV93_9EUKA